MRKRITLLIAALMVALTMALGAGTAFADPNCAKVPNNPNCVKVGPGNSENTPAAEHNPNVHDEFTPPGRS
jgi:hypothetical protein